MTMNANYIIKRPYMQFTVTIAGEMAAVTCTLDKCPAFFTCNFDYESIEGEQRSVVADSPIAAVAAAFPEVSLAQAVVIAA
jgi:hypothetical protein